MAVYFIGEVQEGCFCIKIGVSKSISKRLRNLQTGNSVPLKLLGWIESRTPHALEKSLHRQFAPSRLRGEWFAIEPADVFPVLRLAASAGFVAKNADAFEIVGYDRDAMPEYLGVWEWGEVEIDECCPFCGCLCGMAFQEASQMYHCLNCDALSDFSDESPSVEELDDQTMNEQQMTASEKWLEDRAPGFAHLPELDRRAIFDFAFLWSLFEGRVMEKKACVSLLLSKIDEWLAEGSLNVSLFDAELAYFRARYYCNGVLDPRFEGLRFRDSDRKEWVADVIRGAKDNPRDRLLCLLVIVWRLRNNLFHGEKWDSQLQGQRENFMNANNVLMRILDQYGKLA